ncbi:hypothetical protein, partial [Rhizobium leguminosarum]|uniref:hypothetical protein n=1 Tax=Rhizobium leguminosarum TaxID=384 RepID=UPI001953895A
PRQIRKRQAQPQGQAQKGKSQQRLPRKHHRSDAEINLKRFPCAAPLPLVKYAQAVFQYGALGAFGSARMFTICPASAR